jgi:hypothetical protein
MPGSTGEHSLALVEWLLTFWNQEFEDADALFAKGLVSRRHVNKLFCPNDIIISIKSKESFACVLRDWPEISEGSDVVLLSCWNWGYDGSNFTREECRLRVYMPHETSGDILISDLETYPLKYAKPDLESQLKARGQKFWDHRTQHFVSYKGWDTNFDLNHVSLPEGSSR